MTYDDIKRGALVKFTEASGLKSFEVKSKTHMLDNGWVRSKDPSGNWVYFSPNAIVSIHE